MGKGAYRKAMFALCSILMERMRGNCSDTLISSSWPAGNSVCKIFDQVNCNIVKDNYEDCRLLRGDCIIVKFSRMKDRKQVFKCQKRTEKYQYGWPCLLGKWLNLILIKDYAPNLKCFGHGAKSCTTWEEFTVGMCLVVQSK